MVGESPFAMECKVDFTKEYQNGDGKHTTTLVVAKVVMIHVREDCIKDGGVVSLFCRPFPTSGGSLIRPKN